MLGCKRNKNIQHRIMCLVISLLLLFMTGDSLFAVKAFAITGEHWSIGYKYHNCTDFTIDKENVYSGSYSIKIDNTDYNDAFAEMSFSVKPSTRYKFSAMVKYAGYAYSSDNTGNFSGASIGKSSSWSTSSFTSSNNWTKLEYSFDTGDAERSVNLCLRNGMYGGICRGTAWFSDIKLEECQSAKTNQWNFLVVIFKHINAPVTMNGRSYNYVNDLDDVDVAHLTGVLNNLYDTFESISGGLMDVKTIDIALCENTITKLGGMADDYNLDPALGGAAEFIDSQLAIKEYNQIIAISPISDLANGWAGLGGGHYNGTNYCQITYTPRSSYPGNLTFFPDAIFVHETLHCLESNSISINPEKTAVLHDNLSYGYTDIGDEWRTWYTAYMRAELAGGKGLDPSVYWIYNDCRYAVISDNMKVSSEFNSRQTKTICGRIDFKGNKTSSVTVELLCNNRVVNSVKSSNGNYSFSFEKNDASSYSLRFSRSKCPARVYDIHNGTTVVNAELRLYGDVNGDGYIDAKDATQILRYEASYSSVIDDNYILSVANVLNKSTLSAKDATQILRYDAKMSSVFDSLQ